MSLLPQSVQDDPGDWDSVEILRQAFRDAGVDVDAPHWSDENILAVTRTKEVVLTTPIPDGWMDDDAWALVLTNIGARGAMAGTITQAQWDRAEQLFEGRIHIVVFPVQGAE
jgi:hypothetical protein